jgi:hypothetical protein
MRPSECYRYCIHSSKTKREKDHRSEKKVGRKWEESEKKVRGK